MEGKEWIENAFSSFLLLVITLGNTYQNFHWNRMLHCVQRKTKLTHGAYFKPPK